MDIIIKKTIENLEKNNIQMFFVETKKDVVPQVSQLLNEGDIVTVGGSMSLFETGVIEYLRCGRYDFLDRYKTGLADTDIKNIYFKAMDSDTYFCSCNAVTENGEIYNVDGNANRISAISYGPKSVIMIVGINKIVKNINEAILRVKTITAPKICKRRGSNTYCKDTGYCISVNNGNNDMTSGCDSIERVCCSYLITGQQRIKDRIKIILVNEELGY
jgi:L-lactate utilization protein LutB